MKFGGLWTGRKKNDKPAGPKASKEPVKTREQIEAEALDEAEVSLGVLYGEFRRIFERERRKALGYEREGITNQDNYVTVGLAFYSMTLIKTAQNRLYEIRNSRELYGSISELSGTIQTLNGVDDRKKDINVKGIAAGAEKMSGASGGSSRALLKAYETLYNLKQSLPDERSKNTGIDAVVDRDFLKKLIHDGNVEECVRSARGLKQDPQEKLKKHVDFQELVQGTEAGEGVSGTQESQEDADERLRAEMRELINNMPGSK